jgi:putative ABC transport system permease protein
VLLGHTVARDLFGVESPIGRRLMINRIPFTVIGVLAERGQGLDVSNEDDQVYIPLATAMHRVMNLDHYSAIVLEISEAGAMDASAAQTESILRQRHRIRTNQADDFQIQNQKPLLETQAAAAGRLRFFLRWIGGSALAVSGLGILGITWIVTKERTRDFGTCRALGATAQDIFYQVWFESTVLALIGGCVGFLIAWPISLWTAVSSNLPFIFDRTAAMLGFCSALAMNLAFSILPSRKAALVHPSEALRHE